MMNLSECNFIDIYIASLYYNLNTILTIGYGDIVPVNIAEFVYVIIYIMFGSFMFTYAIASLSTLFSHSNFKHYKYETKLTILDSIFKEYNIPNSLYNKLIQRLKVDMIEKEENDRFQLLESLPNHLRIALTMVMYKTNINQNRFFINQSHEFILYVLPLLKYLKISKGDILISPGQLTEEMFLE